MKWREWEGRRKDFEAKLKMEFPLLYEGLRIHWSEGGMLGGIGVGPGWWDIICEVSRGLESLMEQQPAFRMKAVQVKEKYGGLRYYVDKIGATYWDGNESEHTFPDGAEPRRAYEEAARLIRKAERESLETCEYCGAKGAYMSDYSSWLKTLCAECHEERKRSGR